MVHSDKRHELSGLFFFWVCAFVQARKTGSSLSGFEAVNCSQGIFMRVTEVIKVIEIESEA